VVNDNGTGNSNVQFSDSITSVKVTATDIDSAATSLNLGTITYVYTPPGGAAQPAANGFPSGLGIGLPTTTAGVPSSTPGVYSPPSSREWIISGQMTALTGAGTYAITVPVTDGYGTGSTTLTIIVIKEDAAIEYSGDTLKSTGSTNTNSTATMTLAAVITEAADGNLGGQLNTTQISFKVFKSSDTSMTTPIAAPQCLNVNVTATGPGSGTAACSVNLTEDNYMVTIELESNPYYKAPVEDQAITVVLPGTGMTTGGGWLNEPTLGSRSNFGFTVKYLRNGNVQGNGLYIYRKTIAANSFPLPSGGFLPAGEYNWIIKSNAMVGMTQTCMGIAPNVTCTSTFTGKNNIAAVNRATGVAYSLGGNYNFQVDVSDNSEPGSSPGVGPDSYALRVWDTSTGTYYQLGTPAAQLAIVGGNIQVKKQ